jgi:flagellar biosynthesis/type III secretory pathway protein FliH
VQEAVAALLDTLEERPVQAVLEVAAQVCKQEQQLAEQQILAAVEVLLATVQAALVAAES